MLSIDRRSWLVVGLLAVVAGIATSALLYTFDPNTANSPFPPCSFRALTGWYCVGCGGTRALHALVHGDLFAALRMNALAVALLPLLAGFLAWQAGWQPRRLQRIADTLARPLLWIWLLPLFGVLRNLPWAPFSWLAPG
ncbi:MAG: DUF2752 domain-containing protein [Lysobacteraceae bacterium]|nr:DUF2752 domain-containing protein [Xanthomonadales bacterium]